MSGSQNLCRGPGVRRHPLPPASHSPQRPTAEWRTWTPVPTKTGFSKGLRHVKLQVSGYKSGTKEVSVETGERMSECQRWDGAWSPLRRTLKELYRDPMDQGKHARNKRTKRKLWQRQKNKEDRAVLALERITHISGMTTSLCAPLPGHPALFSLHLLPGRPGQPRCILHWGLQGATASASVSTPWRLHPGQSVLWSASSKHEDPQRDRVLILHTWRSSTCPVVITQHC